MNLIKQTDNQLLRFWGNLCSRVGVFFLNQADRYGDLYEMTDMLSELEKLDDTFAYKEDD
jgi:hypothetical protein